MFSGAMRNYLFGKILFALLSAFISTFIGATAFAMTRSVYALLAVIAIINVIAAVIMFNIEDRHIIRERDYWKDEYYTLKEKL